MTTVAEIAKVARNLGRDFGTFFEINFPTVSSTLRLPHPLVEPASVIVVNNATGDEMSGYTVNSRQGLLKIPVTTGLPNGVYVSGIYYQWFLDEDLEFFADVIATEHLYQRTGVELDSISGPEVEVMGIGTLVQALWSLLAEFATDIDVSTPEGMNIPVHQRFQQTQALIQYWQARYDEKAALLNIGLKKIESFNLRRVSRLTNRLVPLYRTREVDDPRPPVRVRPPIDPIGPSLYDDGVNAGADPWDIGWNTIGSGGS